MFGIMIDCSRNAVMNVATIKKWVDLLKRMGYDTLMLYTEDTYEVDHQPYFGHQRGRYTKQELKELDAYCVKKGIELIPCIQTLAHLNCMFKWGKSYGEIRDCDDILLIGAEKTYQLIRDMFATLSECFSSKRIHIGMDEAYNVGLGKYLREHGYEECFGIIQSHLHKVCEIAAEYELQPMIWSDMFCKLALGSEDYYKGGDPEIIRKKADLPENISLVYWDYYSKDYDHYEKMLKVNQAFGKEVIFAGGAWTWKGFAPDNQFSIEALTPAIRACRDQNISNFFITLWGDDGGECSRAGALPALYRASCMIHGNSEEEEIRKGFQELTGMDIEDFMLLEQADWLGQSQAGKIAKTLLYNDPLIGSCDYMIRGGEDQHYQELKEKLKKVQKTETYEGMFSYMEALCDVLSVKSELGVRTRKAYLAKDNETLRGLAEKEYRLAIEKVEAFHEIYQCWWMSENKPQGFEVQDLRLGGLQQRLKSCQSRLLSYCEGKLENIPELEETVNEECMGITWARLVTPGVISHTI